MQTQHRTSTSSSGIYHRIPAVIEQGGAALQRVYDLVLVSLPDTSRPDRQRMCLAPRRYLPLYEYVRQIRTAVESQMLAHDDADLTRVAVATELPVERVRSMLMDGAVTHPFGKPFVVRASRGELLFLRVTNMVAGHPLHLSLVDDDYGMQTRCTEMVHGAEGCQEYEWRCHQPGIYPIFNAAAASDEERRCLLGVLIVEP